MSRTCASDEWPVPKFSIDRRIRFRRSRVRMSGGARTAFIQRLSVSSSVTLDFVAPEVGEDIASIRSRDET